ncbi:MAG TPA: PAS domain-containing protein, partial [Methanobacterium sp.]|nr:PAS domain-containing protein [Methanobacterium sp.]
MYKSIFESSFEAIILTTPEGFILAANPKAEEIFGYSENELQEIGVSGITDAKDTKFSVFLEKRRHKGNASTELTFLRKNGEKFLGLVSSHNFIDENGNEKNSNVIRDLNELKKLKLALNESEDHKQNLFENMREGYAYCRMLFDKNGNPDDWIYLQVNKAFDQLTGLKNITGKRVTEAIPGIKESEPELFEIYGRVALTGNPERFEFYFKPLKMWLNVSVYMPKKEHFVAVFDNITERIKADEELKNNQEKYHNLFDNAHVGIFRATIKEPT